MRVLALAAIIGGLTLGGVAQARTWTDAAGRFTFDAPNGWATSQERGGGASDTFTYVITGNANNECHIIATPNPNTTAAQPEATRRTVADPNRINAAFWASAVSQANAVFRAGPREVLSTSLDTSGFWPIARAEIQGERLVHASMQLRPGVDIITYCMTYGGADPVQLYETVTRSVSHPNDATWRAQIEQAAAGQVTAQ